VVLEEAPGLQDLKDVKDSKDEDGGWQLFVLSARTPAALDRAAANLAAHLESHPDLPLADVAYTLQIGRRHFEHRRAVLCRTHEEAIAALREPRAVASPRPGGGEGVWERGSRGEGPGEAGLPELEKALLLRWLAGEDVDWSALHAGAGRRRVPLPTYPFEKQRYWVEATGPDIPRFTPPEELKPEPELVDASR
jgi:polyketide synthase PksJ